MNKRIKLVLLLIALIVVSFAIFDNSSSNAETQISPEPQKNAEMNIAYSDFTLQIPQIGLTTQMTKITRHGPDLPVPENHPGYYSIHDYNLFIVGHNHTIFKRLNEIPKQILIWQNNQPKTYNLAKQETKPKEQISMDALLDYHGIVIMTCAGNYTNSGYSHRLILYYT